MGEKGKAKVRPRWERVHAEQDPRRVETRPSFPSIQTLPPVHFILPYHANSEGFSCHCFARKLHGRRSSELARTLTHASPEGSGRRHFSHVRRVRFGTFPLAKLGSG